MWILQSFVKTLKGNIQDWNIRYSLSLFNLKPVPGVVESLKVVTKAKTERIARYAFDFALKNNRKKVTIIHKANIMKKGDGLFLNTCREVGKLYESSGIKTEDMIVDNASMQVFKRVTNHLACFETTSI